MIKMNRMKLARSFGILTIFIAGVGVGPTSSGAALEDIRVVVAQDHTGAVLSPDEMTLLLRDAYQGRPAKFSSGVEVRAIDRPGIDLESRERFYRAIAGRTPTQMRSIWSQIVFTGRGQAPLSIGDLGELKKKLSSLKGAISFLSSAESADGLKVISLIHP